MATTVVFFFSSVLGFGVLGPWGLEFGVGSLRLFLEAAGAQLSESHS